MQFLWLVFTNQLSISKDILNLMRCQFIRILLVMEALN